MLSTLAAALKDAIVGIDSVELRNVALSAYVQDVLRWWLEWERNLACVFSKSDALVAKWSSCQVLEIVHASYVRRVVLSRTRQTCACISAHFSMDTKVRITKKLSADSCMPEFLHADIHVNTYGPIMDAHVR